MRQTDIYSYFAFGFDYSIVKTTGLLGRTKQDALNYLEGFFAFLNSLDLQVTQLVASDLLEIKEAIKASEEPKIEQVTAQKVKAAANKLDASLDAELKLRKAYVLTKKRYGIERLLSTPQELLGANVWVTLSDTAKKDFQLACTQVALSQPTATAFHLMRSLEEQIKVLYFSYKKTHRLEKPMWGPMTAQLRIKRAPKPTEKLLNHLDGMRVHFRNPTQHPNIFYTLDECQDLLNQTITAINMIAAELPK